jgi:DNA-binding MarR family transcriptional regulator
LSVLSTLAKEWPMTPAGSAERERLRPASMTRVGAPLCELGVVVRAAHPVDGRQVLVSASTAGVELISAMVDESA